MTQNPSPAGTALPDGDHVRLFSYGTLQQRDVQLATFGRDLEGRRDVLPGYRLSTMRITASDVISVSGSAEHPFAVATGKVDDEIPGIVLTLTAAELAAADRYEVDDYIRVEVLLRSGTRAWAYVNATSTDRAAPI